MRLSEAIRLGSMLKPQGFDSLCYEGATCAIGAALDARGRLTEVVGDGMVPDFAYKLFPILNQSATCPASARVWSVSIVILGLNDVRRWTREQIADWVETLERAQEPVIGSATQPAMEPAFTPRRSEAQK